ncbi:DUF4326 domain-containing protein [Streptomyces sp. NPDC006333]|uniref:DUF4326 domain-containing protein n=1 Tax=Streptomyces sp. NPDC006333 TaxID=3156753 RepID=UPI0033B50358
MPTTVISLKGRIHEFGPRLEHAPADLVYVGRRWTLGHWDLPRHPLANPFVYDTATRRRDGTRAEVMEKYRAHLLGHPELLDRVRALRGRVLACWCAPEPCHGDVLAELADAR